MTMNKSQKDSPFSSAIRLSKSQRRKMPHTAETEKNNFSDAEVKLVETFWSVIGSNVFNSEIPLSRICFNNQMES